jgi:hypothetical protein
MADDEQTQRDLAAYAQLLALWMQENPIKTTKLQVLLAVNGGLASIVPFMPAAWTDRGFVYLVGAVLSGVWLLSIGRTVLYQQLWSKKLAALEASHPNDPRFAITNVDAVEAQAAPWLRALGGVSSKYYLLGAPLAFALGWLLLFANRLLSRS